MEFLLELSDSTAVAQFLSAIEDECGKKVAEEIENNYMKWGVVTIGFNSNSQVPYLVPNK